MLRRMPRGCALLMAEYAYGVGSSRSVPPRKYVAGSKAGRPRMAVRSFKFSFCGHGSEILKRMVSFARSAVMS